MHRKTSESGGTLILAMLLIVVFSGIVAVGNMLSSNQILLTARAADVDSMQSTAEGLADYAYGVWKDAMMASSDPLTTSQASALVTGANRPALPSFMAYQTFTISGLDASGAPASAPSQIPTLSQDPKGWQANSYEYVVNVVLVSTNSRFPKKVSIEATLRHDLVPPVGGLFYSEGDFELYKPAPMMIGGNVHTNANGYVSTHGTTTADKLRFLASSNISFVGSYQQAVPPKAELWSAPTSAADYGTPIYDRGQANQVSKVDKLEGIGMGTASQFDTTDSNPNNDGNRELIERPVAGYTDPPGIANSRLYNNAGLVVDISGPVTGTPAATLTTANTYSGNNVTITAKNGTTLTAAKANAIIGTLANTMSVTTSSQQYVYDSSQKKYVWKTVTTTSTVQKTVYDKREASEVLVSDVDVGALGTTLNTLTNFNNILYINNTADTAGGPKAIRLDNGGVLPTNGLTVATEGGLYVMGDYNTGTTTNSAVVPSNVSGNSDGTALPYKSGYTTKPAALVADAVMVLSNNWSDSNDASALNARTASHTTINSAVIAGYIPSAYVSSSGETYGYSGGANNFPRFLENWGSKGMTFYGAFVQLFKSQMFTGQWDTGDIYAPPNRRWNFDNLLLQRVIPGIPAASAFSRSQFRTL